MTTTTQLREWWAPPCQGPFVKVELHGEGAVSVRPEILPAVAALDACLKAHNYQTRRADTGAYNCRKITGGTKYSLHAYGIALDLNWQSNPYGSVLVTDMPPAMVAAIKAIRTRNGRQVWRWGGNYSGNKDAMHFEIVCSPADIASGIASPDFVEDDMTPEQAAHLEAVALLAIDAQARLDRIEKTVDAIAERQVPESTVRADIVLNRKIAVKVGVPDDQIPK